MDFANRLKEKGFDLMEEMIKLYPTLQPHHQMSALLAMMRFCYPTMKSIEMKIDDPGKLIVNRENIQQLCLIARKATEDGAGNNDPA